MRLDNKLLNKSLVYLEVAFTIFWMLFFMGVNFTQPFASSLKSISYPTIGLLVLFRWRHIPYAATRDPFLILTILIAILSIFWTVNLTTTSEGIRGMVRTFIFAAYIAARYTLKDQMKLWAWVLSIILVGSSFTILFMRGYAVAKEGGWQGIMPYKNFLGYTMSLAVVLFMNYLITSKGTKKWFGCVGVINAIALVILARSSASLISVLVLVLGMPLYKVVKQYYKLRVIIVAITSMIFAAITILVIANMDTILVDILGEGLSFNGRTPIWELAIGKGLEKPWLGFGFNAFWNSEAGRFVMVNTWSGLREDGFNTHNAFLEQFLSLGFIGLGLSLIQMINVFARIIFALNKFKTIEIFWLLQLQVFTVIVSLADSYDVGLISAVIALSIGLELSRNTKKHHQFYLQREFIVFN